MTRLEAIEAMKNGQKVTHRFFDTHEWIAMTAYGTILTEEDFRHNADEFWSYRTAPYWQTDWEIKCL